MILKFYYIYYEEDLNNKERITQIRNILYLRLKKYFKKKKNKQCSFQALKT